MDTEKVEKIQRQTGERLVSLNMEVTTTQAKLGLLLARLQSFSCNSERIQALGACKPHAAGEQSGEEKNRVAQLIDMLTPQVEQLETILTKVNALVQDNATVLETGYLHVEGREREAQVYATSGDLASQCACAVGHVVHRLQEARLLLAAQDTQVSTNDVALLTDVTERGSAALYGHYSFKQLDFLVDVTRAKSKTSRLCSLLATSLADTSVCNILGVHAPPPSPSTLRGVYVVGFEEVRAAKKFTVFSLVAEWVGCVTVSRKKFTELQKMYKSLTERFSHVKRIEFPPKKYVGTASSVVTSLQRLPTLARFFAAIVSHEEIRSSDIFFNFINTTTKEGM